ncbi:hypothetical protein CROQUDRAFT_50380 [Cronartium quercuum f. sp. fusiforme G11]|uniref:Uncharacterized protein n=1 Tax=Cronartium quercuum f. sp. fusiforme G11 TaxID=708437 RepID=A0A9P6NB59_9BASI|nr:hypothetical protein CROQUDRAFT_50380 [Cronartium quercuum f. sp. fusiforme G11]
MASAYRLVKRFLGIGKEKYFVGNDLAGNRYYQLPNPVRSLRPKRQVEFEAIGNDHTLQVITWISLIILFPGFDTLRSSLTSLRIFSYHPNRLPPQWAAWLSFTRPHSPTIQELQNDRIRQERLQHNVRQLEQARLTKQTHDTLPPPEYAGFSQTTSESDQHERIRKWNALNQSPLEAFLPSSSNPDDQWAPQSWMPTATQRKDPSSPQS